MFIAWNMCFTTPNLSTEPDRYMTEIPALPGCRAWGDTPEQTLDILQSVAEAFLELSCDEPPSNTHISLHTAESQPA